MVAAKKPDARRHRDLQREQQAQHLQLVIPSVHEVAVEDKVVALVLPRRAEAPEEQQQVPELPVDVAEDFAGCRDLGHRRLRGEHLAGRPGDEDQRVQVLGAEEVDQNVRVIPLAIELVHLLHLDLLGEMARAHHDDLCSIPDAVQHRARRVGSGAHLVLGLVHGLVRYRFEVQHLRVHELPREDAPVRDRLGVLQRQRLHELADASWSARAGMLHALRLRA
mmetsp:Transcript_47212/g.122023  ORF Transcript_47212/g.122023 Transcript_47212/m.122023 type:complete len:222 (+) Transcript_47212:317-982(+)